MTSYIEHLKCFYHISKQQGVFYLYQKYLKHVTSSLAEICVGFFSKNDAPGYSRFLDFFFQDSRIGVRISSNQAVSKSGWNHFWTLSMNLEFIPPITVLLELLRFLFGAFCHMWVTWCDLFLLNINFDDSLWSKSTIYNLCGPLGPNVDATVKIANAKQKLNSRNSVLF